MATATHALRCMIIDFAEDYDRDPHNPYIAEKAAMCKLFSIEAVKKVSDEMLEIFGGDGYFEDSLTAPPSASTATAERCGWRRAPPHPAHHYRPRAGAPRRRRGIPRPRLDRRHESVEARAEPEILQT